MFSRCGEKNVCETGAGTGRHGSLWLGLAKIMFALALGGCARGRQVEHQIRTGDIEAWVFFRGSLESRDVRDVFPALDAPAVLIEICPDGAAVREGDILARFDASQWEREAMRLERDYRLAVAEYNALVSAKLPLELQEISNRIAEVSGRLVQEERALEDIRQLAAENMASSNEVEQAEARCRAARQEDAAVRNQERLTRLYLHPSAIERAAAAVTSAEQELNLARRQISNAVVRAPVAGTMTWKLISIGGEFRAARIGDTIFRNQPFLTISDMSNLVVRCEVAESEITGVAPGAEAVITPLAMPRLEIRGRVETVGATARRVPGWAGGQKFFPMTVGMEERNAALRPGMSVQVRVLSERKRNVTLIPRVAVWWEGDTPYCYAKRNRRVEKVRLNLGAADDRNYEVGAGLAPGDRVLVR